MRKQSLTNVDLWLIVRMIFLCPMVGKGNGTPDWFLIFDVADFRSPHYLVIVLLAHERPTQDCARAQLRKEERIMVVERSFIFAAW
mmetsp:Transcript_52746/g.78604  ORF Transcript_52746/g.78604 Transcript_52746/m.78604 type:complete len:86 (+) Transcript_52746:211-468(+)